MKQKTAKTVAEVLTWIDTTPHHWASAEEKGFFVIGNHDEKLRIPNDVHVALDRLIEPNPNTMDRRMYRLTRAGRAALRKAQEPPPNSR